MATITSKVIDRRIEVVVPKDWPEGTEVEIHPRARMFEVAPPSPDEWRRRILETAGQWQGEFE